MSFAKQVNDEFKNSQIEIYQDDNGNIKLDVRFDGDAAWLTQKTLANLFSCSVENIILHLKNIYQEAELEESATTIAVLNKTLDSLGIVMEREFSRKTTNSDKQLRIIGRATKSLTKIIENIAKLTEQLKLDKLHDALMEQRSINNKRAVSKDTSFIMESSTKDDDSSYNDNIDVIDVTEFEKQYSSCMMDFLHGWSSHCKLSYNGEVVGAIVDIKLLNKLQKIGSI